jgi:hypothetical protein
MTAYTFTSPLTTTFTPNCAISASTSGVNNAQNAYNWFSMLSGASGNAGGAAALAITDPINKAIAQSITQQARSALLPLVKAELFAIQFSSLLSVLSSGVNSATSTLNSITNPALVNSISSLTPSYASALALITNTLNTLKTLELTANAGAGSIDVNSASISTSFSATTALTSFPAGSKTYISTFLDPNTINGATIPALTAVNGNAGNAATLYTIFNNVATNLASTNVVSAYHGQYLLLTNIIFDSACMELGGVMVSGSTNHGSNAGLAGGVGFGPGRDYSTSIHGDHIAASTTGTFSDFWIVS